MRTLFLRLTLFILFITQIALFQTSNSIVFAQNNNDSTSSNELIGPNYPEWKKIRKGLEYSKMLLPSSGSFVKSELYLLKIDPNFMNISGAHAPTHLGKKKDSVKSLVKIKRAVAGINANFFDTKNDTLGLLIIDTETLSPIHKGGKLLSGIFQIKQNSPSIISRSEFLPEMIDFAIQSGPRLIINSEKLKINSGERSRRSGIAITKNNEIILFATKLRFPGATLEEIQSSLLDSNLGVISAINLDGGGSSQLFFYKDQDNLKEISLSGGDDVTSALLVFPKEIP